MPDTPTNLTGDENMGYGNRTIHVPASGPVADAPRPNAAEPAPDQGPPDGGVAKVDAELASRDNNPDASIVKGVKNPYVSRETTEGAQHSDNAAVTPADEKPPTADDMTGVPGGEPKPEHYNKEEPGYVKEGFKDKADETYGDDDKEAKSKAKKDAADDKKKGDKPDPIV